MQRDDDSILSANTPGGSYYPSNEKDYSVYRCLVITVKYVDDDANISKGSPVPEVMYDCQIIGGYREGHILTNVRAVNEAGGNNNFAERIYKASNKKQKGVGLSKQDGDIVYVAFVAGDREAGIILGGANHVLDEDKTGAKKADGPRLISQYNGVFTEIDKDGNYTLKRLGGTYDETTGEFTPSEEDAAIIVKYETEKITKTFKSGLKITEDGENDSYIVETKGGAKVTVDGKAGTVEIDSSGAKITIDKAGNIKLDGDFVDLGKSASDFVPLFLELLTAFNTHTHTGNLAAPTSPPNAPMLSSVGSTTVKVQP